MAASHAGVTSQAHCPEQGPHLTVRTQLRRALVMQVPTGSLPQYKEVLDPLLPGVDAKPIHTTDYKDGRRIPTLAQLLEEAR